MIGGGEGWGGGWGVWREVVSERGRGRKNLRRKETGLELCGVYGAASFHTLPSFMLLSQCLQSTVALLQINSDCSRERVGLSAARSIVPIHTLFCFFCLLLRYSAARQSSNSRGQCGALKGGNKAVVFGCRSLSVL